MERTLQGSPSPPSNWEALIITLPAPVYPGASSLFDRALEGAVSAMVRPSSSGPGYLLDRHWYPWQALHDSSSGKVAPGAHAPARDCAGLPGIVRFRAATTHDDDTASRRPEGYILYIVGESPIWGVDTAALTWTLDHLPAPSEAVPRKVLGPYFSGTARSLAETLATNYPSTDPEIEVVTGTMTSEAEYVHFCPPLTRSFRFTSFTGIRTGRLGALASFIKSEPPSETPTIGHCQDAKDPLERDRNPSDANTPRVAALLREDLTAFGHRRRPPEGWLDIPISPSVAWVRKAYAEQDAAQNAERNNGSHWLVAQLDEEAQRQDLLPQLSHDSTVAHDLALTVVGDTLRQRGITNIGIHFVARDDVVFVARRMRRELPEARLLLTTLDRLYLSRDYALDLDGALVASPYPGLGLSPGKDGDSYSTPLSRDSAEGIYWAMRWLLYGKGGDGCPDGDCRSSAPRPVVGVIRNGRLWPLQSFEDDPHRYQRDLPLIWWVLFGAALLGIWPHVRIAGACAVVALLLATWRHAWGAVLSVTADGVAFRTLVAVGLNGALLISPLSREWLRQADAGAVRRYWHEHAGMYRVIAASIIALGIIWLAVFTKLTSSNVTLYRTLHLLEGVSPLAPALAALTAAGALSQMTVWRIAGRESALSTVQVGRVQLEGAPYPFSEPSIRRWPLQAIAFACFASSWPLLHVYSIAKDSRLTLEDNACLCAVASLGLFACFVFTSWQLCALVFETYDVRRVLSDATSELGQRFLPDIVALVASELRWRWSGAVVSAGLLLVAIDGYPFHPQRILETWGATLLSVTLLTGGVAYLVLRRHASGEGGGYAEAFRGRDLWRASLLACGPLYIALQNYFPAAVFTIRQALRTIFFPGESP